MTVADSTTVRPLALVTGASSGIGLELAKQFAGAGFDLIINAEDADLAAAADQVRTLAGTVTTAQVDLRSYEGVEELWAVVQAEGRPLAAAALNAGVGQGGAFIDTDLAADLSIVDLNVRSTVHLAKRVLTDMARRECGRVLVTSSIAATMPGAYQPVYNASKSFLQSFVEAVQSELGDKDVVVTSLMPGPTETEFFERAGMTDTRVGASSKDDAAQVARQGFEALMAGRDRVVAGSVQTRVQELANKVLPDKVKAAAHARMAAPGTGAGSSSS